jgi:selenocysteine-specific elongation factor
MHVVCTAGHVDHGKSTLVRALTGMEPDRFAEEQRRGLTIDLGFAWTRLPGEATEDLTVAFVDLPGHERFIANMLAGAGPVSSALFVVAADEGWMPQSREHLDILDLLGTSRGVVALTRSDLVDEATIAVADELVREELAGSALADVEVVAVSAVTGAGLDELVSALVRMLRAAPAPEDHGRARLWVDRSFSITGAGTVVTGTLTGGWLRTGDTVEVQPGGAQGRVRALESLKEDVDAAPPGSRVAVNVAGLERSRVARGDALGLAGAWRPTAAIEARVTVLPGQVIAPKGAWHLHAGSGDWAASVHPVGGRPITGTGYVRVELARPAALAAGDRFVLRDAGRRATVGGGAVLDADPPARVRGSRQRQERLAELEIRRVALEAGSRDGLLVAHVSERGIVGAARATAAAGLPRDAAVRAASERGLVTVGDAWADPEAVDAWGRAAAQAVSAYHDAHPVERAAPKDVALRALVAAGCPPGSSAEVLAALVPRGRLVPEGTGVRTLDHEPRLDERDAAARDALLAALAEHPFSPPGLTEAARAAGASDALVRELEADGLFVRLAGDLAFLPSAVEEAVTRLAEASAAEGPLTAARAKEVLQTSRKFALPLLEHLDRTGRTRRRGDVRVVL